MPIRPIEIMEKHTYDPDKDGRVEKGALEWALNKLLKGAGTGADPTEIDPYADSDAVSAAEAAGLALASGKNIKLISALTADQTWSGLTAVLTAGENLTIGQACYMKSDGKMWKSLATAVGTMPVVALATGTIDAEAAGEFLLLGFFREDTVFTFTVGGLLYASAAATGALTNTAPAGAGDQVQVCGLCFPSVHVIYFNPSLELVEIP